MSNILKRSMINGSGDGRASRESLVKECQRRLVARRGLRDRCALLLCVHRVAVESWLIGHAVERLGAAVG
jgi:hypothetical protein